MNTRGFTSDSIARLMHNGARYADNRGSKILYNSRENLALVIDRYRRPVITALDRVNFNDKVRYQGWRPGW